VKNLSFILNAILFVAVAILYYFHFSSSPAAVAKTKPLDSKEIAAPVEPLKPSEIKASDIVYVNIDTLDAQYLYILDNAKQINGKQSVLQNEYRSMSMQLQKEADDAQKAAQAGVLTGESLEKVKGQLEQKQNAIVEKQNQIGELEKDVQRKQLDMLKKLADFLARYNSAAHYKYILPYSSSLTSVLLARADLDITNDVIKGLNAEYKAAKGSK
jgi:outer membrane protein